MSGVNDSARAAKASTRRRPPNGTRRSDRQVGCISPDSLRAVLGAGPEDVLTNAFYRALEVAGIGADSVRIEPDESTYASPVEASVGQLTRVHNKITAFRLRDAASLLRIDRLKHPEVRLATSDRPGLVVAAAVPAAVAIEAIPAGNDPTAREGPEIW